MHLLPVFLLLLTHYEISEATTQNRCGVGYKSYGYTEPAGDIYLRYGEDLNITCVLNEDVKERYGPDASKSMHFYLNEISLPVDIINSTAIQLHVQKHQKTRQSLYYCKINEDPVCSNVVVVGVPPKEVTDFSCTFLNYQNFTCSFTEPENYISTRYSLYYAPSDSNRYKHALKFHRPKQNSKVPKRTHACPTSNLTTLEKGGKPKKSCFWSLDTSPPYRHSHTNFTFFLDAVNYFGSNTTKFLVKHYERIKPSPPEKLTGVSLKPDVIKLEWNINIYIQPFPIGLIGRVSWLIEGSKNWTSVETKIESQTTEVEYFLKNLPYAHCLYDIRVDLKSPEATDEALWSAYESVTVRTLSKIPDVPPKTTLGMFELVDGTGTKRIYWQNILANQENGENFSYFIEVNGYPDVKPSKIQNNYAEFQNLEDGNYTIRIWSKNQVGKSDNSSIVFLPSRKSSLREVEQLIKVDNGGGSFDIQWKGTNDHRAVSYTLFWCSATKERPHPCDGRIYWEEVPLGVENKSVILSTSDEQTNQTINIYQFAIAVNGVNSSSGMSWADCTVINESGFQLRQTHFVEVKSRYITLKWELECIRMGTIKSFEVKYCQIPFLEVNDCPNGTAEHKIFNNTDNSFGTVNGLLNVTGLKPYTSYMFMVKPILISGKEMKFGPVLRNSTEEDAPSPPRNLKILRRFDRNVTIQWDRPLESNGYLRHYIVTFDKRTIQLNNITNTVDITYLLPRTKYTIFVEACTLLCSEKVSIEVTTDVGRPGRIKKPGSNFEGNNSLLTINWIKPDETEVKVDHYEVEVAEWNSKRVLLIANTSEPKYPVDLCLNDKTLKLSIRVRAFNIKDDEILYGNWTDKDSFVCWESSSSWTVPVIVMGAIFFVLVLAYTAKTLWHKVVPMRDFAIKLPASLGPTVQSDERDRTDSGSSPGEEPLLKGDIQQSAGIPSGDSSGCSSGTESVSSSADTASHMSISDSGTDQPKSPTPSLTEALEKDVTIRQRPNVKKSEYLTMAEIPQTSWPPKPTQTGYSVIGLSSPPVKEVADPPYLPLSEIAGKSTFPAPQTKELPKPSSGYVACPPQEPPAKNTGYVVAGMLWKTD